MSLRQPRRADLWRQWSSWKSPRKVERYLIVPKPLRSRSTHIAHARSARQISRCERSSRARYRSFWRSLARGPKPQAADSESQPQLPEALVVSEASTELDSEAESEPAGALCADTQLDETGSDQSAEDVNLHPTQYDSASEGQLGCEQDCRSPAIHNDGSCRASRPEDAPADSQIANQGDADTACTPCTGAHCGDDPVLRSPDTNRAIQLEESEVWVTTTPKDGSYHGGCVDSVELVRQARDAGISFGRVFQDIAAGAWSGVEGACTLDGDLLGFARALAAGDLACSRGRGGGLHALSSVEEGLDAAGEVWAAFGGPVGYASFAQRQAKLSGAGVELSGAAAWQRLLREIDVAVRLASLPQEELARLSCGLASLERPGKEEPARLLMLSCAFPPLRRRICYVAWRVAWGLHQLKVSTSERMRALVADQRCAQSPILLRHAALLESQPRHRSLVDGAVDEAIAASAGHLRTCLEAEVSAGCHSPGILLRAWTQPSLDLQVPAPTGRSQQPGGHGSGGPGGRSPGLARRRVRQEMARRGCSSGRTGGCLGSEPSLQATLVRAFEELRSRLSSRAAASAGVALVELCRWRLDDAMSAMHPR
mmetsp:Transcript_38941/g.121657  ORF Transcript_38941/g.121657 Transcript_38941/m.121657 type:complete len:598 (+) Transcript_38941:107-1900(+)